MKAFIFAYSTNYDLGAAIIYVESKEEAIKLANKKPNDNYIWDCYNIHEIDTNSNSKVIIIRENTFDEISDY